MTGLIKGKKGQVLVISIAALLVLFILSIVLVETGNLIYHKIHMQNIADSGAMEAGLWYARSLNIVSLSNKILALSGIAGIIGTLAGFPEVMKTVDVVRNVQDVIAGTGAFEKIKPMAMLTEGAVIRNGNGNKVFSIGLFNMAEFGDTCGLPSFNLQRRRITDALDEAEVRYYFRRGGKEKVYVDKSRVRHNSNIENREAEWKKVMTVKDPEFGTKFLSAEKVNVKKDLQLDIIEEPEDHTILVLSFKNGLKQLLNTGFLKKKDGGDIQPAFLMSSSMVNIDGGSMDIFDLNGANYSPKIMHITLPEIEDTGAVGDVISEGRSLPQAGLTQGGLNGVMQYLDKGLKFITEEAVLH